MKAEENRFDSYNVHNAHEHGPDTARQPARLKRQRPPGRVSLEAHPGRVPLQATSENGQKRSGKRFLNVFKSSKRRDIETLPSVLETDSNRPTRSSLSTPARASTFNSMATPKLSHKDSKKSIRFRAIDPDKPVLRTSTTWDPPPLFQAYPQSIKHGRLQASNLSADHILRLNQRRLSIDQGVDVAMEVLVDNYESEGKNGKYKRSVSRPLFRAEWTEKIYILVTSGYLLQYSSDGHHDRLPEKILQLNKDSVAFASDAIPGKHWVLQISRTASDEGVVDLKPSKSLMSRLGFHSQETRRTSKSFLLVMNNPEELDSWLATVRREIESLGSGKYFGTEADETSPNQVLGHRSSRTLLIKRDPTKFSNQAYSQPYNNHPNRLSYYSQDDSEGYQQAIVVGARNSVGGSTADQRSTHSGEVVHESSEGRRQSVNSRSSGLSASRSSFYISEPSTPPPIEHDLSTMPEIRIPDGKEIHNYRAQNQHGLALSTQRGKFGVAPNLEHADAGSGLQNTSPVTPNFSMPSFSKRFSAAAVGPNPQPPPRSRSSTPQPSNTIRLFGNNTSPEESRRTSTVGELPGQFRVFKNVPRRESTASLSQSTSGLPTFTASKVYPKRLSSLEYAHGKFPAPSPPPKGALPSLPKDPSGPVSALRRPVSMQLRPSQTNQTGPLSPTRPLSHYTSTSILNEKGQGVGQNTAGVSESYAALKESISSPPRSQSTVSDLGAGSPMGPPPTCPLPEIPVEEPESTSRRNSFSIDGFGHRRRSMAAGEGHNPRQGTSQGSSRRSIACP